ncbi:MAG: class I SAM-dependent methyltransferase [Pseudomonadota bacterium]
MTADLQGKYDAAFYANQKAGSRTSAGLVIEKLAPVLGNVSSVLDVGCGAGGWLQAVREVYPKATVFGVDHPAVPRSEMFINEDAFAGYDLSEPIDLERSFDLVITLEVAEHIPPEKAETFLETLTRHGDVVLFSAAIPRQGGTGHVNEQWPEYWIDLMAARDYKALDIVRPLIWNDDAIASWYKQNMLLFAKSPEKLQVAGAEDWAGRAMIHPGSWVRATEPLPTKISRVLSGRKPDHAWR